VIKEEEIKIGVGSEVMLVFDDGDIQRVKIIPKKERDFSFNDESSEVLMISSEEILGEVLLGKGLNEEINYRIQGQDNQAKILEIK
jgi:transcription elongation GreA/GreB family factor